MNWKIFSLKYDNRETWAFEMLSYFLFCGEFNNRVGLFRYKNQVGVETEPIEKDGVFYGFQAKFYTTSIKENKDDIIDSIKKAKSKNTQITEVFLYVNRELSESTRKYKKEPQYQIDIENAAKAIGVYIHWRVPSHFERQLSLPENKYLYDIFFTLEPSNDDLCEEIAKHNQNILCAIQTEIPFCDQLIKIDRSDIIEQITNACNNKKNIIISGEGGCGKTAILKEFYLINSNKIPICIFKSSEFNITHINDIFRFEKYFTFNQFLDTYNDEPVKIFVFDSAEKLAELSNHDIVKLFIKKLKEREWQIIFTTRYSYLNDLMFHIKETFCLPVEIFDISLVKIDELEAFSVKFNFSLPVNQKFTERLRNLFYLNEFLLHYGDIDKQGNFRNFIELLWKKRIQNNFDQKDNLHLNRERTILSIAKQRCETGQFFINTDNLPESALFHLTQDEILGYDEVHDGYFITHDIYEEWTLDKIVSRCFANRSSPIKFFNELGNSLPMRRAFRLWLSDQLYNGGNEIEIFIQEAFSCQEISLYWKDEILISVLLSDYSEEFFKNFENKIIESEFKLLKRILFLLNIACTDISSIESFEKTKPKGRGWESVIYLIYKYKSDFFSQNQKISLLVLSNWSRSLKNGITARYCGLLALSIIQKTETEESFFIHEKPEEEILKVIFNSVNEIKSELIDVFEKVLANKWTSHHDPYHGLCEMIIAKPYLAIELIKVLPHYVIQLCDLFWQKRTRQGNFFDYDRDSMETKYGLVDEFRFKYYPASANQTPTLWLLRSNFYTTLNFIIDFTNRAVLSYSQSDYGRNDVEEITLLIDGKKIKQFLSWSLWGMYRGISSPVVPELLQSIHMALEKALLEYVPTTEPEIIEKILFQVLEKSKSASLTSIVCSIVLAYPDKFYNVGLALFQVIELFHLDSMRSTSEFHAKTLYGMGYGLDRVKDVLYTDERMETCNDEHRNSNLESLFLKYQLFGIIGFSEKENAEFIEKLYRIIDNHKSSILSNPKYEKNTWAILLARMDRRNLTPKISQTKENQFQIEFTPKVFPDELKKVSKQAQIQAEDFFKYSSLRTWSDFLIGKESKIKIEKHNDYNINPHLALSETKQLIEELNSGRDGSGFFESSIPPFSCSKLIIEFKDLLQNDDLDFCKEIILESISRLFNDGYDYQISDGVEAAFHALPSLIELYPEETEDYILVMVLALFDETSIGAYKRICDYVIESIHKSKLWVQNPRVAQSVLSGYIKLKPLYKSILDEKRKGEGQRRQITKMLVLQEFEKRITDFSFSEIIFDVTDIDVFDATDLEIVFKLIPSQTEVSFHLDIFYRTIPMLAPQLLADRRLERKKYRDDSLNYSVRLSICKSYASFILQREQNEIDKYLTPFLDNLSLTEETNMFICELITAEDRLMKNEQFWYIWNNLYKKIKELCTYSLNYYSEEVIISFLLAWRFWQEGIEEWHSLRSENLSLYVDASMDMGYIPAVLYSMSRVLNTIGTRFTNEGIDWLHAVVINNRSLQLGDLESNTLYYLEIFLRKYIFNNRQNIKKDNRVRNKVIPILDFMIERGSIHGYLLRESIF